MIGYKFNKHGQKKRLNVDFNHLFVMYNKKILYWCDFENIYAIVFVQYKPGLTSDFRKIISFLNN